MISSIPPRLRAPLRIVVVGAVIIAVALAAHGWSSPIYLVLIPFVALLAVGYYVWGGRDTDWGAAIRRDADERQAQDRLKIQALVGRVMSVATAIAYLIAFGLKAPLWPFALALALPVLTSIVGHLLYRDQNPAG